MLLDKLTPQLAIVFASDSDPDKKATQQCEAEFYVGQYLLAKGDTSGRDHIEEAARICSAVTAESLAAKLELARHVE